MAAAARVRLNAMTASTSQAALAVNLPEGDSESQSVTTVASKTGQRYLNHRSTGSQVLRFPRPQKVSALGTGAPYLFIWETDYAEHRGERPVAITWHLRTPMPTADFAVASVVM